MTGAYTIGLLLFSNCFMTFAWYGHLKFKSAPLYLVILVSWSIAFFEYMFQVPANRIRNTYFSVAQLKTIQEVISLFTFICFSIFYLGEPIKLNYVIGFTFIVIGASIVFYK